MNPLRISKVLRDDYLAVYDHVAAPKAICKFQWCNCESQFRAEYFGDADFKDLKETRVPHVRFPLTWDWGKTAPVESIGPSRRTPGTTVISASLTIMPSGPRVTQTGAPTSVRRAGIASTTCSSVTTSPGIGLSWSTDSY